MRLFVAVDPPVPAVASLTDACAPLRAEWPGLRWVEPAQWHLTLAFLGEVEPARVEPLAARLARAAGRYPPLGLRFAGGGTFPRQARRARVVWTGVDGARESLARLAASVAAAARRCDVPVEDRAYRPHLTLARLREPADVRPVVAALSAYVGPDWTAEVLHLVRSHLGPQLRHERFISWPLRSLAADQDRWADFRGRDCQGEDLRGEDPRENDHQA